MAKKNGKATRTHRKAGEPLPNTVTTKIVLQVVAAHMTEAEFTEAYDKIPRKRFGGPREISSKITDAYKVFRASKGGEADFDVFVSSTSLKIATAERYLGRLLRDERNAS